MSALVFLVNMMGYHKNSWGRYKMRIYKYSLDFSVIEQDIEMPIGAEILSVQLQDGKPQLWALVDETRTATEKRRICVFNTGEPAKKCSKFLGTIQLREGEDPWVAHVFETYLGSRKEKEMPWTMAEILASEGMK